MIGEECITGERGRENLSDAAGRRRRNRPRFSEPAAFVCQLPPTPNATSPQQSVVEEALPSPSRPVHPAQLSADGEGLQVSFGNGDPVTNSFEHVARSSRTAEFEEHVTNQPVEISLLETPFHRCAPVARSASISTSGDPSEGRCFHHRHPFTLLPVIDIAAADGVENRRPSRRTWWPPSR